jgi:hypothetical protein
LTSNALAVFLPQEVVVRPLPQLYAEGSQEQRCPDKPGSLTIPDEEFYQRRLKSSYVPPPVGRDWRGNKQEPSSIRSNLRFSGTYAMEGRFLSDVTEKGIYIDFFS